MAHAYDKAEYHAESVEDYGLPEEHAANHTVFFLRWLIERGLMSRFFGKQSAGILRRYRSNEATIHEVYERWDQCLVDDMLSEEGNAFARHYFEFRSGRYLSDYIATLQGDLPSELHVDYTEENYQRLRPVIGRRYEEWKASVTPLDRPNGWRLAKASVIKMLRRLRSRKKPTSP